MIEADIIVIGAGIVGASSAAVLSETKSVVILDMEARAGYHTTGRSAALFTENYGTPAIKILTRASRDFFENPPKGFCEFPLLTPRGIIHMARADQLESVKNFLAIHPDVVELSESELHARIPHLKSGRIVAGLLEADAADIDVNALHTGYLRQAKNNGAELHLNQAVTSLAYKDGFWEVTTGKMQLRAPIIVNAAGAWVDEIAKMAGVAPIGIRPLKRTAAVVQYDKPIDRDMCFLNDIDENWYCKPEGSHLFISPEDEQPSAPCDAWADDMDIAAVIEAITEVLDLEPVKVESSWAGLRSFTADGDFVVGFAEDVPGFFWLAGQGGYGIQTAPAVAALSATLILNAPVPDFLAQQGLDFQPFSPTRFPEG